MKLKFLFIFLRVIKSDQRTNIPPFFVQKYSGQNLEIAILLETVQRPDDKTLGSTFSPPLKPRERVLTYALGENIFCMVKVVV